MEENKNFDTTLSFIWKSVKLVKVKKIEQKRKSRAWAQAHEGKDHERENLDRCIKQKQTQD